MAKEVKAVVRGVGNLYCSRCGYPSNDTSPVGDGKEKCEQCGQIIRYKCEQCPLFIRPKALDSDGKCSACLCQRPKAERVGWVKAIGTQAVNFGRMGVQGVVAAGSTVKEVGIVKKAVATVAGKDYMYCPTCNRMSSDTDPSGYGLEKCRKCQTILRYECVDCHRYFQRERLFDKDGNGVTRCWPCHQKGI